MQAVETIEEALQLQRRRSEDPEPVSPAGEKLESCRNKHRCLSPSLEICGSTASTTTFCDEGKGKLKRNKSGSQETGIGENKSEKAPKCPKLAPKIHTQTQEQIPLKTFLSPRNVGENGDETEAKPEEKKRKTAQPQPRDPAQDPPRHGPA